MVDFFLARWIWRWIPGDVWRWFRAKYGPRIVAAVLAWEVRLEQAWCDACARAAAFDARARKAWSDYQALMLELREEWKDGLFWFTWYQFLRSCEWARDYMWPEYRKIMESQREDEEDWQDFLDEYGITCFEDIWRA